MATSSRRRIALASLAIAALGAVALVGLGWVRWNATSQMRRQTLTTNYVLTRTPDDMASRETEPWALDRREHVTVILEEEPSAEQSLLRSTALELQVRETLVSPMGEESIMDALKRLYDDPVELSDGTLTAFYHQNGAPKAQGGFNGRAEDGQWTFWDKRGNVVGKGAYVDGVPDGPWFALYADGSPHYTVTYVNGLLEGYCEYRKKDGQLSPKTGLYQKGMLVPK